MLGPEERKKARKTSRMKWKKGRRDEQRRGREHKEGARGEVAG
jgi:hypothetical protein